MMGLEADIWMPSSTSTMPLTAIVVLALRIQMHKAQKKTNTQIHRCHCYKITPPQRQKYFIIRIYKKKCQEISSTSKITSKRVGYQMQSLKKYKMESSDLGATWAI